MTTSVWIDDDLKIKIHRLAELGETTAEDIVRKAVIQLEERVNARANFLQEADTSWDAYQRDGLYLTGDEVSMWLRGVGTDAESELPECHN